MAKKNEKVEPKVVEPDTVAREVNCLGWTLDMAENDLKTRINDQVKTAEWLERNLSRWIKDLKEYQAGTRSYLPSCPLTGSLPTDILQQHGKIEQSVTMVTTLRRAYKDISTAHMHETEALVRLGFWGPNNK